MSPKLPRLTAKQLIKKLKENGYVLYNSEGSHQHFIHPQKPEKITIPVHTGKIKLFSWSFLYAIFYTLMLFGDGKKIVLDLIAALKEGWIVSTPLLDTSDITLYSVDDNRINIKINVRQLDSGKHNASIPSHSDNKILKLLFP